MEERGLGGSGDREGIGRELGIGREWGAGGSGDKTINIDDVKCERFFSRVLDRRC